MLGNSPHSLTEEQVPMPDILSIYAEAQPEKPGVIDDKPDGTVVTWTYAELEAQSNRVANLLLSLGSGPGKKIIWCGPNSPEVVAVINAARKIGAVAVPLNYRLTPEEAEYVVNHSDAADRVRRLGARSRCSPRCATSWRRCGTSSRSAARRRRGCSSDADIAAASADPTGPGRDGRDRPAR